MGKKLYMQHDCLNGSGCFNDKHRLRFDMFAESLPGETSLTDVDGFHECGGRFLFLESKTWLDRLDAPEKLNNGQSTAFRRLCDRLSPDALALAIAGDPRERQIFFHANITRGWSGWRTSSNEIVLKILRLWTIDRCNIECDELRRLLIGDESVTIR